MSPALGRITRSGSKLRLVFATAGAWLVTAHCAATLPVTPTPPCPPCPCAAAAAGGDGAALPNRLAAPADSAEAGVRSAPSAVSSADAGQAPVSVEQAPPPAPSPGACTLILNADPEGDAWVDQAHAGKTPVRFDAVPGVHSVSFRHAQFAPISQKLDCRAGEWIAVHGDLRTRQVQAWLQHTGPVYGGSGSIAINSIPKSRVFVDGDYVGTTPCRANAASGLHTVVFEHPTYGRKSQSVLVKAHAVSVAAVRFP